LKFTRDGCITVKVAGEIYEWEDCTITNLKQRPPNKKNLLKITVEDSGAGMPEEVI
jgi:signal transduction histidine kinase